MRTRTRTAAAVAGAVAGVVALVGGVFTGVSTAAPTTGAPTTGAPTTGAPTSGAYRIVNGASGLCLTVPGASGSDGVQLTVSACNGASNQTWTLAAQGSGVRLTAGNSGKCAGVTGASTSAGKAVQQETCTGATSQTWELTTSGANYQVVNANSDKCLNTKDNSTSSGALVQQNSCDSVATKQWTLQPTGSTGTPTSTPTRTPTSTPSSTPTGGPTTPPTTGLVGWATQGGGTSGGAGGPATTVTSLSALTAAVKGDTAKTVQINGNFTCSDDVRVGGNTTLVGVGANSGLTGCGVNIRDVSNVIVRNLKISKVPAGNGNGDAIHLDNAKRVWLDHNDLSSDTSHGTDYYDGLLDITHGSDYVTVSWNKLHDHVKCSLVGHSDSNSSEDTGHLRVTYHHNAFQTCAQRNPRVRFGNPVHVFSNYYYKNPSYTDYSYGIASTCGAGVLVEGNYFENVAEPTHTSEGSSPGGSIVARNNYLVNSGTPQTSGSVASIPYSYTVDNPSGVKANVLANAGTGKI
ncbi:pectate lyase family protein [Microbispora amethystogenes]|uniref:pectate lyase family protein n=1 Tax=Microbispora amethystogenes TaxID=1427754 RepID=UPI001EF3C37B|nr:RICIN domain-containing protein [Microbispora amethystogenes]